MEEYLQETVPQNTITKEDEPSLSKWKPSSEAINESKNGISDDFDCNICLETVQEPVVTLCGHLYCWPCIYKWINPQQFPNKPHSQCPICKTEISQNTIVPLYIPGPTRKPMFLVPRRPATPRCGVRTMPPQHLEYRGYRQEARNGINPTSPTTGMFGELVYETLFGDLQSSLFDYPNSYSLSGMRTQRARRQAMLADRSLGRICFFLFCCVMVCLFAF